MNDLLNKKNIIIAASIAGVLVLAAVAIYFLRNRSVGSDDLLQEQEIKTPVAQPSTTTEGGLSEPTSTTSTTSTGSAPAEGFYFEGNLNATEENIKEINALLAAEALKATSTAVVGDVIPSSTEEALPSINLDTDSDTIPDSAEPLFGTDPKKADTDGDTFPDADEIKNGYNPLGTGKCTVKNCVINQ
jgi:hypothetical protein